MTRLFTVAYCLTMAFSLKAQDNPYGEISIASPNAASLGKFVEIPVNTHIGTPNIAVPIHTISNGPLKLKVGLAYHASGLKVMENASWVGAGWALEAGGVITRTINGLPDEKGTSTTAQTHGHFSDFGFNSYLYNGNLEMWQDFADGIKDGEPDIFYYNFAGYSGKFYFADDRTPVLMPMQDIKIEYNYTGGGSIASFILTTPDGTKYHFGRTSSTTDVDPVEITSPFTFNNGLGNANSISSWYLNKILSADQQFAIDLTYQRERYSYYTISMFPVANIRRPGTREFNLVKNYIDGVRLSRISTLNMHIDFMPGALREDLAEFSPKGFEEYPNTEATSLAEIQIKGTDGSCFKKFTLGYGYFVDNTTGIPSALSNFNYQSDRKRLRLDNVTELSCNGIATIPPYIFTYHDELVPRKLTFAQDHWGYYNGATFNAQLIPSYTINTFEEKQGANRNSSWPEMRGGALRKITYPTGGFTELEVEPHRVHVIGTRYVHAYVTGISIGYDGSNPINKESAPITLAAGLYSFGATTSSLGSYASFTLVNVNNPNQSVVSLTAQPGQTIDAKHTIPAGTYKLKLFKDCSNPTGQMTGVGASASIGQMQPVGYATDTIVGGLRIKTLTQNLNGTGNNMVTSYTYSDGNKSSGVLYGKPTYVQLVRNDQIKDIGYWNPATGFQPSCSPAGCIACIGYPYYESPSSIRPLDVSKGYHIGYNEVKASEPGNGYTIYRYFGPNPWEIIYDDVAVRNLNNTDCSPNIPNFPAAPPPFDPKRGDLKYEGIFTESGKLISEKTFEVNYNMLAMESTPAFIVSSFYWAHTGTRILLATHYSLNTAKKISTTVTESTYSMDNNDLVTNIYTQYFNSPYHNAPTEKTSLASDGSTLRNKYKYAFDYMPAACESTINCSQQYIANKNTCLNQYNTARSACTDDLCRTNAFLAYRQCLSQSRITYSNCRRTNYTNPVSTYNTCFQSAVNSANADLKPVLGMNLHGRNTLIEQSEWLNNDLLKSTFHKYDYSNSIIYPQKTQLIDLATPSASFTTSVVNGSGLTKDSRYNDESSAKFTTGNLTEITTREKGAVAYLWDYWNSLPVARANNTTADQIAFTSFEAEAAGNWFIPGAAVADPTSITGKKCYLLQTGGPITKLVLTAGKEYIVSYWTKNTTPFTIAGTISGYPLKGATVGGWTYYEHKITGQAQAQVSGAGYIDELRLYPSDAEMFTYTYDRLAGITSECDDKNRVIYYLYDPLLRLQMIKDHEGRILKHFEYQYQSPITQ